MSSLRLVLSRLDELERRYNTRLKHTKLYLSSDYKYYIDSKETRIIIRKKAISELIGYAKEIETELNKLKEFVNE